MSIVRSVVYSENYKKHTRINEFGRQKAEILSVTVVKILCTSKTNGIQNLAEMTGYFSSGAELGRIRSWSALNSRQIVDISRNFTYLRFACFMSSHKSRLLGVT
jgi:hypothetical protein